MGDLAVRCELRLTDETSHATVADGRMVLARGGIDRPDVVVETDTETLKRLVFGDDGDRAEALESGRVRTEGDHRSLARLAAAFTLPAPATDGRSNVSASS